MNNKEKIEQAKAEQAIQKFSRDYDSTMIIRWIFGILALIWLSLTILEGFAIVKLKKEPGVYLTGGVILAVLAYVAGYASCVVQSHFQKKATEQAKEQQVHNGVKP